LNGPLYFAAWDGTHGFELWKSDGTDKGTILVKDIYPGNSDSIPYSSTQREPLANVNGELYFIADDGFHGISQADGACQ
jgi:ELWxxDGT repeat protein